MSVEKDDSRITTNRDGEAWIAFMFYHGMRLKAQSDTEIGARNGVAHLANELDSRNSIKDDK